MILTLFILLWEMVPQLSVQTFCTCRNFIKIWSRVIFIGSSGYLTRLYTLMEWCMGWERRAEVVGSSFQILSNFLLASNLIFGMFLGILLYFRCQLDATLQHLRSQEFCSFGSTLLAMTVASISSSLSWPWFWRLYLELLHCILR